MRRTSAAAVAAAIVLTACSGGSSRAHPGTTGGAHGSPASPTRPPGPAAFTFGTPDLRAVGDGTPAVLAPAVTAAVKATLDSYLNVAVVTPIRTGEKAGDLGPIFTGPALAQASGADRAALVDEDLPASPGAAVPTATATITALIGPDGPVVISAAIHVTASGKAPGGDVSVDRTGELVLSPDGDTWKVSGYTVTVNRQVPTGTTTTAAHR